MALDYTDDELLRRLKNKSIHSKDNSISSIIIAVNYRRKTVKMGSGKWISLNELKRDYLVYNALIGK